MGFAVCVTYEIKAGQMDAFLPRMLMNARQTLELEEGCRQFDVLSDPARPKEVMLYEVYDTPEAFARHMASPQFRAFDTAVLDMVARRIVKTFREVRG